MTSSLSVKKPWLPYVLPFFVFIILTEIANWLPPSFAPWLYLVKTICTALLLFYWRKVYAVELKVKLSTQEWLWAIGCGLAVLVIWVGGEPFLPRLGTPEATNPYSFSTSKLLVSSWILIRLVGSSFVVPLMEELFWRSFLMRYFINSDFRVVPLGAFSWFSFLGTALLFGAEHNRIAAGVLAGILYGALLVKQKKLIGVIVAHAVTNLSLGLYVILTGSWIFW